MINEFPILKNDLNGKKIIYLDSAATSLTPISVQKKILKFYNEFNANVHRSTSKLAMKATEEYEKSRSKIAKFINAKNKEIIFTKNTSESINLIARMLTKNLKEHDEIIISIAEHHSNLVPWQQLAKEKNLVLKFIDINNDGTLNIEHFRSLITDKTKIVSITQISNVLGLINPIKELAKITHEQDAIIVVDGAQSVGHISVDVKKLDVDFLAFSGHKMFGPTGIGVLYGKEKILSTLEPIFFGGEMIEKVSKDESSWNELPWKFEPGTPNISGAIGLGKAIDYINEKGINKLETEIEKITEHAIDELNKIPEVKIFGFDEKNIKNKTGVICFSVKNINNLDIAQFLDLKNIQIRTGNHCAQPLLRRLNVDSLLRISFYSYNTIEEIDFFIKILKETINKLSK